MYLTLVCVTLPLMDSNFHLECGLCDEVASLEVYTFIKKKKRKKSLQLKKDHV